MERAEGPGFQRFAGGTAIAVGIGGIAYSAVFVGAVKSGSTALETVSWLLLLLGGLLTIPVLVALYRRLVDVDAGVALWALLLGSAGAVASIIHAGWDLARLARPPGPRTTEVFQQLPNWIDPYGLMTFGIAGLSIILFSWLIRRGGGLPRGLGVLGSLAGVLLILVYLGRLILFDPNNVGLLAVAAVTGVAVDPAWFIWLGVRLRRS